MPPFPTLPPPHERLALAAGERVQELGGTLTEEEARAVLTVAGWPDELVEEALAIAWCESRWSPYAVGDEGASRGWFQLWTGWASWYGVTVDELYDPVVNARVALAVYLHRGRFGGSGGWTCAAKVGVQ